MTTTPSTAPFSEVATANLLTDICSILNVVENEWKAANSWSDWDQQVRDRITEHLKHFYSAQSSPDVEKAVADNSPRGCSCHPDDAPVPCQGEHALTHCKLKAAEALIRSLRTSLATAREEAERLRAGLFSGSVRRINDRPSKEAENAK